MTLDLPGPDQITALVLAGGRGSRMGGLDKGLVPVAGRPLIEAVLERLRPQAAHCLISANRNLERYRAYGCPVLTDPIEDYPGPLAGVLAALEAMPTPWLLTAPCDAPALPRDLGRRLAETLVQAGAELASAHDGQQLQPLHALIPARLAPALRDYLQGGGRGVQAWMRRYQLAQADFTGQMAAFSNLNSPEEQGRFEALSTIESQDSPHRR